MVKKGRCRLSIEFVSEHKMLFLVSVNSLLTEINPKKVFKFLLVVVVDIFTFSFFGIRFVKENIFIQFKLIIPFLISYYLFIYVGKIVNEENIIKYNKKKKKRKKTGEIIFRLWLKL